jgi:adenosylcobyric acid synthase
MIVLEGAGGVAEINLWDRDFTNLSMAQAVGARSVLVADIERGGVFASILGTLDLLPSDFRKLIRAFAVNRFRGDRSLFATGVTILEEKSGLPCLGVFPFAQDLHLDAEDSLASSSNIRKTESPSRIAVIRFPRISNSTDLRLLPNADWLERPNGLQYRFIVLPGTKSTIADLGWLRLTGLADWIVEQHMSGATIIGICGGYQMLGETIDDPHGVDGTCGSAVGLGLAPVHTEMAPEKVTVQREASTPAGVRFQAYEIHMGRTIPTQSAQPFAILADGTREGIRQNRVIGTYLHGALESPDVVAELFEWRPPIDPAKDRHYDALADWLEETAAPGVLAELIGD